MNRLFFLLPLISFALDANAQNPPGSPYSYFGIGDIYQKGFGQQLMKGGTGIADRDPYAINNLNPASYSIMGQPFSVLNEFGSSFSLVQRDDGNDQGRQIEMDFPYIALAFFTGKNSGASVGLRKYSNVNYNILGTSLGTSLIDEVEGEYRVTYEGIGSLNEVYIGYGVQVTKRLSLGAHLSYIFGTIENNQHVINPATNFNVRIEDKRFMRTPSLDFGLQYMLPINQSVLTFGATYNTKNDLSSSQELLMGDASAGGGFPVDTLAFETQDISDYMLPRAYGFGVSWDRNNKFKLSMDLQMQLWSESTLSGSNFSLQDSRRLALGFEKLPNFKSTNYLAYVRWGLGLYAEQSYLVLDSEGLNNIGATLGCSLPVSNKGMVRFVVESAARGQQLDAYFDERYTKFTINVTFMDFWFVRRRLD